MKAPGKTAKATSNPSKITTRDFIVPVRWVEIEASIPTSDFEELSRICRGGFDSKAQSEIFRGYAASMWVSVSYFRNRGKKGTSWYDFRIDGSSNHWSMFKRKALSKVTIRIKEQNWISFIDCCRVMEVRLDSMIRAAFQRRIKHYCENRDEIEADRARLDLEDQKRQMLAAGS